MIYKSFAEWWGAIGSGIAPRANEDHEEHAHRVAEAAWRHAQKGFARDMELRIENEAMTAQEILCDLYLFIGKI